MKKGKSLMLIAAGSMLLSGCIGRPLLPLDLHNQPERKPIEQTLDYAKLKSEGVEKIIITARDETCEPNGLCASEFDSKTIEKIYSDGRKKIEHDFEDDGEIDESTLQKNVGLTKVTLDDFEDDGEVDRVITQYTDADGSTVREYNLLFVNSGKIDYKEVERIENGEKIIDTIEPIRSYLDDSEEYISKRIIEKKEGDATVRRVYNNYNFDDNFNENYHFKTPSKTEVTKEVNEDLKYTAKYRSDGTLRDVTLERKTDTGKMIIYDDVDWGRGTGVIDKTTVETVKEIEL